MSDNTKETQEAPLDKSLRKFKMHLTTYPNKQLAQLLRGYVVPILEELRFEYSDAFSYLEDRLDSGDIGSGFSDVLEESKDTVLFLASLLDTVLTTVGWLKENEVSEEFPAEIREMFDEAKGRVVSLMQSIEEAQSDDDDDDDGDDDDDADADSAGDADTADIAVKVASDVETVSAQEVVAAPEVASVEDSQNSATA